MNLQTVWVPFSALNSSSHSASVRLVSILLGLRQESPLTEARLRKFSGLDPKTIALARERLAQTPLAQSFTWPRRQCAAIPVALLTASDLSASARLLYGQLQGVSDFADPSGSFTFAGLSKLTGSGDGALRRAAAELAKTEWLFLVQKNRKSPLHFTLRDPVGVLWRARISSMKRRVLGAEHKGEALFREYLNAMVALDEYQENATPDFLLNPFTRELMEFDRYYPTVGVAVEFNGDQRYEVTDLVDYEKTVKQVGRDAMKAFICKLQGVELAIIHPEDLSLTGMEKKIPALLPRRDSEGMESLLTALEELAADYRQRTAEERIAKASARK